MNCFDNKDDYEDAVRRYEEYEREWLAYQEYMERLEEESMNFTRLQEMERKEKELARKKEAFEKMFREDEE